MSKPNAPLRHHPDPTYLRWLIASTGLTQREVAQRIGCSGRLLRYYLTATTHPTHRPMPYPEQYTLEGLVAPSVVARLRAPQPPPTTIGA
jgi:transcriptional regulator with XRE-family HTH domain